jgi:hypothetical protein
LRGQKLRRLKNARIEVGYDGKQGMDDMVGRKSRGKSKDIELRPDISIVQRSVAKLPFLLQSAQRGQHIVPERRRVLGNIQVHKHFLQKKFKQMQEPQ